MKLPPGSGFPKPSVIHIYRRSDLHEWTQIAQLEAKISELSQRLSETKHALARALRTRKLS